MVTAAAGRGSSCCDAAHSEAMGKYLRAIYLLTFKDPPVSTSDVAARLGVAAPSVSAMLRRPARRACWPHRAAAASRCPSMASVMPGR